MTFKKIEGFQGKIFVPDDTEKKKKHNCGDCFSCQWCSDERCEPCLKNKADKKKITPLIRENDK